MTRRRQSGVTLMELLTVMVVVALLAAIAIPSYRTYAQRAGRAEAKAALLREQNNLERCFSRFNAYDDANCAAMTALEGAGVPSGESRYTITGVVDETVYTLSAAPTPGGGMTDDDRCGTLTLTSAGVRGIDGGTGTVAECWR